MNIEYEGEVEVECPKCKHKFKVYVYGMAEVDSDLSIISHPPKVFKVE